MNNLNGKVALVTGAAARRGIGHGVALRLATGGADVVVIDKYRAPRSPFPEDKGWGGARCGSDGG
jgi:NAD(P)-dependent dehydrogenase (short-subunit alcohol dehydrogenase family)